MPTTAISPRITDVVGVLQDLAPRTWTWQILSAPVPEVDAFLMATDPSGARYLLPVEVKTSVRPPQLPAILARYPGQPGIVVADDVSRESRKGLTGAGWSWIDLGTGEVNLGFGGLQVTREVPVTRSPVTRRRSPLTGVFAGTSLGIVRRVLVDHKEEWTVARMAAVAGASSSLVSRVFTRLEAEGWLERRRGRYGRTWVTDAWAILDAWAETKPPAQSVDQRVSLLPVGRITEAIAAAAGEARYALTGAAAAELIGPFARFATVDLYVDDLTAWDARLPLTPVGRGGNVRFIRSTDEGVFDGASASPGGPIIVSRPQLYVDLVRRGAADQEAAAYLRRRELLWPR